jgi:molybdopterin synthase catalytic subunit
MLRERAGHDAEEVPVPPGATVGWLWQDWSRRHGLQDFGAVRFAVNREVVREDHLLLGGEEVAFLPPVSGGSGQARVVDRPLDLAALAAEARRDSDGALVSFLGVVRDHGHGRAVDHLEYECYPEMAERWLEQLREEAASRWPGSSLWVHHRVGRLEVGEASVAIVATAPHREEAFAACRHAIERIKEELPVWKKEVYPDGEMWVGQGS